jgi:lipopolysaccharide export system permease protein
MIADSLERPKLEWRSPRGWSGRVPILDRYLLQELLGPLLFGVAAFTSVGLSVGVVFDLVRKVTEAGLPLTIAMQVFLLKMPSFIVLAFPMSILLASLMAYSRLSADSELIALRSCGIRSDRFILPAILLSLVVTGMTFLFNESIVPITNQQAKLTLESALQSDRPAFAEQNNVVYQQYERWPVAPGSPKTVDVLTRLFYARQYDGEKMLNLTVLDFSQAGLNQILTANAATWNPKAQAWDFRDGTIYAVAPDGSYRSIIRFEQHQFALPRTPLDLAQHPTDPEQMNIAEAVNYLGLLKQTGNEKEMRRIQVSIQQKLAFPFVCVVFGLVGATLGTLPNRRSSKATGFGISVLIIFSYYLLAFVFNALGVQGALTPIIAAWLPVSLGLAAGLYLLRKTAR